MPTENELQNDLQANSEESGWALADPRDWLVFHWTWRSGTWVHYHARTTQPV